jgi:hypothetical protein
MKSSFKGTVSRDLLLLVFLMNLPPVSMTPAANFPPVSTTQAANLSTSFACVVYTGCKFATGVSTIPAANLSPVSMKNSVFFLPYFVFMCGI